MKGIKKRGPLFLQIPVCDGSLGHNEGTEAAPELIAAGLREENSEVVEKQSFGEMQEQAYEKAKQFFREGHFLFSLGGDHSVTYPLFRAFSESFGSRDSSLVILDAHADCYQVMKPASNEDYVKMVVKEGKVEPENVMLLGVRHTWPEEEAFIKKVGINVIRAREIREGYAEALRRVVQFCRKSENIYMSIDFDVLDSKIAFATGWPEPDGLSEDEAAGLAQAVAGSGRLKGADFAEYNPLKDREGEGLGLSLRLIRRVLHATGKQGY
jgi:arginase family enzyme